MESACRARGCSRRAFLSAAGLGLAALGAPKPARAQSAKGERPPNVIVIMSDDIGHEAYGCYGGTSYKTPVLDVWAATGARFENAHSQPLCTPSRVKIMTGRYNSRNYVRFGEFPFGEKTFGHVMKSAGYATCIAGKWQLQGRGAQGPRDAGFDEYCLWHMMDVEQDKGPRYRDPKIIENGTWRTDTEGKYGPDVVSNYILDFIERKKDGPFFVYYPMILVHNPFEPTPDSPEWGQDARGNNFFKDMVEYHDKVLGRISDKLDALGLRENTLLLYMGDNGTNGSITSRVSGGGSVKGGKGGTTDAGTHVALIANWKGTIPEGAVINDIVDFSDILPTIAEAGGAALPEGVRIDGQSFLPRLKGQRGNPRGWIFIRYKRDPDRTEYRFVRDQRWKLYDEGGHPRAGKLYDVPADVLEENPIAEGQGGGEAEAARRRLRKALALVRFGNRANAPGMRSKGLPYFSAKRGPG